MIEETNTRKLEIMKSDLIGEIDSLKERVKEKRQKLLRVKNLLNTPPEIDLEKFKEGVAMLYIRAPKVGYRNSKRYEVRTSVINVVSNEIAKGGGRLLKKNDDYYGSKDYSPFVDQCNYYPYGRGPRHGAIMFGLGLDKDLKEKGELSEDEIDSILYTLKCLKHHPKKMIRVIKEG